MYVYIISLSLSISLSLLLYVHTPGLCYKIPVFSDPAPGKSYATTYEQVDS